MIAEFPPGLILILGAFLALTLLSLNVIADAARDHLAGVRG